MMMAMKFRLSLYNCQSSYLFLSVFLFITQFIYLYLFIYESFYLSIYLSVHLPHHYYSDTIHKNINHQYTLQYYYFLMIPGIMIKQPAVCYIQTAS